jgi:hypothetical protein
MGWWKIKDVESGIDGTLSSLQVDFGHQCPTNPSLVNAVPGEESATELYNGDGPADIMGLALEVINKAYQEAWGRPATKEELTAVFNFCCNPMFRQEKKEKE